MGAKVPLPPVPYSLPPCDLDAYRFRGGRWRLCRVSSTEWGILPISTESVALQSCTSVSQTSRRSLQARGDSVVFPPDAIIVIFQPLRTLDEVLAKNP